MDDLHSLRAADGLWRMALPTPTLPPATTTNHYLVGGARAVLVDPSTPTRVHQERLVAVVGQVRSAGIRVEALFLTHHHRDHVGATNDLRRRLDLPVWAHAVTADLTPDIAVDRLIGDGEAVASNPDGSVWQAMHTPGHAPGHLVLWHEASGGMVAGDMVAGEGTILVDPRDGNMGHYLSSLARMANLQPTYLAPAHGGILPHAVAVLEHYQTHRLAREAKVLAALPTAWTAPDALLSTAYGDVSRLAWPIALRSMVSHLIHLQELGQVVQQGDRWRRL